MKTVPLSKLGDVVAIDTETTGLSCWKGDRPFAVSFCDEGDQKAYIRWKVDPVTRQVKVRDKDVRALTRFMKSGRKLVFFNAKFDIQMLEHVGGKFLPDYENVQESFFALRTVYAKPWVKDLRLKPVCNRLLDFPMDDEKDLKESTKRARREGKKLGYKLAEDVEADYHLADPELVKRYALLDAERTILLWLVCGEQMQERDLTHVYDFEMELWPIVYRMEWEGVRVHEDIVEERLKQSLKDLRRTEKKMRTMFPSWATDKFLNSSQQLKRFLYGPKSDQGLALPVTELTRTKQPSTKAEVIAAYDHPFGKIYAEYQKYNNTVKAYRGIKQETINGIIHPNFNQWGAVTGRFSCNKPNFHSMANPKSSRSDLGISARDPFGPRDGYLWYFYDYSGQEARVIADVLQEPTLLQWFKDGKDPHAESALMAFGNIEFRPKAKTIFFAKGYGSGAKKLARLLGGKSLIEGKKLLRQYNRTFKVMVKNTRKFCQDAVAKGYVETAWGRQITLVDAMSYKGINQFVQGSCCDFMKDRMIAANKLLKERGIDGSIVLTVHDELVFEIKRGHNTKGNLRAIKKLMEDHGGKFGIPLPVDVEKSWDYWNKKREVKL